MVKRLTPMLFLSVCWLVLAACSKEPADKIVAKAGDYTVTISDLEAKLKADYPARPLSQLTLEERQKSLDKILDGYRKALWARQLQLDQDSTFQADLKKYSDRAIAFSLYDAQITKTLLPESLMRTYYDWYYTAVKAVIVKVGYKNAVVRNSRTPEAAISLANKYKQTLAESDDPIEAAKELTEGNPRAILANPYQIGRLPMAGDSLIYNTPAGSVGGPLKTGNAVILVKVIEKKPLEKNKPFEMVKKELTRVFRSQLRNQERKMFDEISAELRKKYHAKQNDPGINQLVELIKKWQKKPEHDVSDFTAEQRRIVLGEVNGEKLYAGEYFDHYGSALASDKGQLTQFSAISERFVQQELNLRSWVLEGKATGHDKTEKYYKDFEQFSMSRLGQLLETREVNEKVDATDAEVRAYYDENLEKYATPKRIEIWQIGLDDSATAVTVLQKARAGQDFEALYKKYAKNKKGVKGRFKLAYQTPTSIYKEVTAAAFEAGPHKIVGPVKAKTGYYVVKTGEFVDQKIRPFEPIKSSVRAALINQKRKERRDALMKEVRQKISVNIDENVLKNLG